MLPRRLPPLPLPLSRTVILRHASTSTASSSPSSSSPDYGPPKPPLKSWYTGSPSLSSFLSELASQVSQTRSVLFHTGYLGSVSSALPVPITGTGPGTGTRWIPPQDIASKLALSKIRLAAYRRITALLAELQSLQPLLSKLKDENLPGLSESVRTREKELTELLESFKRVDTRAAAVSSEEADARQGQKRNRKHGYWDQNTGLSYASGKKKTASARAWLVPIPPSTSTSSPGTSSDLDSPIGRILVNAVPASSYFPSATTSASHTSLLLRPFSLTDTLGRYNVFILVRGGGMSAQAKAAQVACARALAACPDASGTEAELEKGATEGVQAEGTRRKILSKGDLPPFNAIR